MRDQNDGKTSQEDQWSPPTRSQYSNRPVDSSFSERFKIQDNLSPCSSATSSINIHNIAISNNQPTKLQMQNAIAIIFRRSPKDITDKTYNQTPKKSRKTETQNLNILSSTKSKDRHKILDIVKIHFPRKSINVPKRYN